MMELSTTLKWRKGAEHIAPDALCRLSRKGRAGERVHPSTGLLQTTIIHDRDGYCQSETGPRRRPYLQSPCSALIGQRQTRRRFRLMA